MLIEKAKKLPNSPGVYKMLDSKGEVIYIGKSKNLRKRVSSYFTKSHDWVKIRKLIFLTKDFDYILCDTNLEARLLECELIKDIKPYFNSQFKNDQGYVYLKIQDKNKPLTIVSQREENTVGPFRHKHLLDNTINLLCHFFPLTTFSYRVIPKEMSQTEFLDNKEILINLFSNAKKIEKLISELSEKMKVLSDNLQFELAVKYRDLIDNLSIISKILYRYETIEKSEIILKIPVGNKLKVFYIKEGVIFYKKLVSKDYDTKNILANLPKDYPVSKLDEKSYLDFRDIIYSEINILPSESVILSPF